MDNKTTENKNKGIELQQTSTLPLMRNNFIIMIVAGVLIVLGFALMVGGGSKGPEFNPDIFSATRIVVGPLLAFLGFVLMGVGIIVRPGRKKNI